jgi:hypothetical protein
MIDWMKTEYPDEANECTVKLTEEQKSDPFRYFHNMQDDFVYEKIRYQYIAAYLSSIKKKANGKFRSISDYRKYYDALQFGCRQQKASFLNEFKPGMQDLLEAYRKEYKREEQKGNVEKMLVPIFTGVTTGGHFSLVIIDRTVYQPGIFFYFGSHESWDKAAFVEVMNALVKTGLWNKDSQWRNNIARGTSGMPQQGSGTNDCGAFTCCLASAFIQNALDRHAFDESRWGSLGPDTFGQNVRFSRRLSVEAWGQYARAHIWNSIKNQMVNFLDTAILKLRYELIDTTPVV